MKRIDYKVNGGKDYVPFWKPWGFWGVMWRFLLFLLLLFLLYVLLLMFGQSGGNASEDPLNATKKVGKELPPGVIPPAAGLPKDSIYADPSSPKKGSASPVLPNPSPHLPGPKDNFKTPLDPKDVIEDPKSGAKRVSNAINIIIDSNEGVEAINKFVDAFKAAYPGPEYEVDAYNALTMMIRLLVPENEREQIKNELPGKIKDVKFKAFDDNVFCSAAAVVPSDKGFAHKDISWYLQPIQAYDAWGITQGSPDVVVAIVDSYFDLTHSELESSRIVSPFSVRFMSDDVRPANDCPQDEAPFYHGTAVASQALGTVDNGVGLCGIAPKCRLMPVSLGHTFTSYDIMQGVLYAIYQGADVINISAGINFGDISLKVPVDDQVRMARETGLDSEDVWQYIFTIADEKKTTIVWSAGNSTCFTALDPSKRGPNTIRVASLDRSLQRADFSNFGNIESFQCNESTISAPGVEILCAMPFNSFYNDLSTCCGTSYSAPIVTGAVALMKSLDPNLENSRIIEILKETGKPIPSSPEIGPMLQLYDALLMVQGKQAPVPGKMRLLSGTWRSDEMLDTKTGSETRRKNVRVFFQSEDGYNGEVKYYESTTTKNIYVAPIEIDYSNGEMCIKQTDDAASSAVRNVYEANLFNCRNMGETSFDYISNASGKEHQFSKISNNNKIDIKLYE